MKPPPPSPCQVSCCCRCSPGLRKPPAGPPGGRRGPPRPGPTRPDPTRLGAARPGPAAAPRHNLARSWCAAAACAPPCPRRARPAAPRGRARPAASGPRWSRRGRPEQPGQGGLRHPHEYARGCKQEAAGGPAEGPAGARRSCLPARRGRRGPVTSGRHWRYARRRPPGRSSPRLLATPLTGCGGGQWAPAPPPPCDKYWSAARGGRPVRPLPGLLAAPGGRAVPSAGRPLSGPPCR